METISLDQLRYPVGKFNFNANADEKEIQNWIFEIENLPSQIRNAVKGLNEEQLNTAYRPEGWTVKQVVHHVADSHMNAYIRIKLALTENTPTITPYQEAVWAEMEDAKNSPVDISLSLLEALHKRWVIALHKLKPNDFEKAVFHPEYKKEMTIKNLVAMYAWHSRHHVAHITELRKRMNW